MEKRYDTKPDIYTAATADQWAGEKTMEHTSGIWGREPMLRYLRSEIIESGDIVVDLGCGGGYPTLRVAEMVGPTGHVYGIEKSGAQLGLEGEGALSLAQKYKERKNVSFIKGDVTKVPLEDGVADKVVSFMVLHNLDIEEVRKTFEETNRILKPGGKGIFLTMHPRVVDIQWDLDFWKFNQADVAHYKELSDKEGARVDGMAKSVGGGEKEVFLINHTEENLKRAVTDAGLSLLRAEDLFFDEKTAREKFGEASVRQMPTGPAYVVLTVRK